MSDDGEIEYTPLRELDPKVCCELLESMATSVGVMAVATEQCFWFVDKAECVSAVLKDWRDMNIRPVDGCEGRARAAVREAVEMVSESITTMVRVSHDNNYDDPTQGTVRMAAEGVLRALLTKPGLDLEENPFARLFATQRSDDEDDDDEEDEEEMDPGSIGSEDEDGSSEEEDKDEDEDDNSTSEEEEEEEEEEDNDVEAEAAEAVAAAKRQKTDK